MIQTDPVFSSQDSMNFEKDAILYCAKGYGNKHGRFYDIPHFIERVSKKMKDLELTIYIVKNEKQVDSSCYVKFVAIFEKK